MALDPSIALAYRPPQVNVDVPSPIQQFGQILSLRNMMQQGQLGQLGLQTKQLELEQLRLAAQQRAGIAKLIEDTQRATQQPPVASPVAPVQPAPIPTPQQYGLIGGPESVPGLPNIGALPSPPPQAGTSLSAMMTQPQTAPAVTAPATPSAASPSAAGPALVAAPLADPFAGLPGTADLIRVGGATGMAYAENIAKAKKTYYENLDAQHKADLAHINNLATIASTVHDEPTKIAAIAEAFQRKLITPEVRDQLTNHPFNKQEWDGFNTQALDAAKRGEEARAAINQKALEEKQAHEKAMYPSQETEAQAKATEAGAKAKTATYGSVAQDAALATDQPSWDAFRAGVPDPVLRSKLPATYSPAAQQQTVSILGQTPNERVTSAETAKQHGVQNVFEAVKTRIDQQKNTREENVYQQTYGEGANPSLVGVDPKLRTQVTKEAQKIGDEYAKAQAVADQFQSLLELARAGNKAAGSNLPLVGVESLNAINGIKRINKDEIKQYGTAGSLLDKIQGKIQGLTQGQPIPADVLNDLETMHNTLRQNSESEFRSRRKGLNDVYKSNFPTDPSSGRGGAQTVKMKAPDGTVRDIPSDQVDHYKSIGASVVQ